jgi:hypothetical protein
MMLCCIGLLLGIIIGSILGIPYITIPLGGAIGFFADIKILHALNKDESKGDCKRSICNMHDLFDRRKDDYKGREKNREDMVL